MKHIVIAGGGLAGSLMAIYLAKRNYKVSLYERRPDMRRTDIAAGRSINLALSDRGIKALQGVGAEVEVLKEALPMKGRMMHDRKGNLSYHAYGKEGQYINSVSRGGLNMQLLDMAEACDNVDIFFDQRCEDVNPENGTAYFVGGDGTKTEAKGDYVLGSDGAFSAVRLRMMKTDRFDYSQHYLEHGYKELTIEPKLDGDFAIQEDCLHIWPRGEYMLIALPNPDKSFTCTLFFPFEGENSFAGLKTPEDVTTFFARHFPDALPLMPNLTRDFFENPTGSLVTVKCYPWVVGKSVLLGDSAHAIVPFYGQGMNAAFEDCTILNQMLEEFNDDWDLALEAYQKERKPNADAIADLAIQNFTEMRDKVGDAQFLEFKEIEHQLCELYPQNFKSQYEMVTFSHIPYHQAKTKGEENTRIVQKIMANGDKVKIDQKEFIAALLKDN